MPAVRAAIVHDYEQLYSSRSRRKHSFIHADFQNSIFDLIGISFNVRHRVVSSPLKIGKTVYKMINYAVFYERIIGSISSLLKLEIFQPFRISSNGEF